MGGAEGSGDRIGVGWRGKEKKEDRDEGREGLWRWGGGGMWIRTLPYLSIPGRRKREREEKREEFGIIISLLTPPAAAIHRLLASPFEKEETKSRERERDPRPIHNLPFPSTTPRRTPINQQPVPWKSK